MTFVSTEFLVLLFTTLALCWNLKPYARSVVLLIASYIFYGWWDWRFLGLIFLSSSIDYVGALFIERNRERGLSKNWVKLPLIVSVCSNLIILGFFKYFNFFLDSANSILRNGGSDFSFSPLNIILPVGISFYTFQAISYSVDVYRGLLKPTKSLLHFLLYTSFFPQLVAGPIERSTNLLPQLIASPKPNWHMAALGLPLVLLGFFKKMVIADNLAPIVESAFALNIDSPTDLLIGVYAYAIQIYCDFSGYTDIARGTSRFFGYELRLNFNLPYFSRGPKEFWTRWHISLSEWLRDYLYIPLGGNRSTKVRHYMNLALTMILGGLWHGAAWTFVLWGFYQGFLLIGERIYRSFKPESTQQTRVQFLISIFMFFQLICLGWLIFRAQSIPHLLTMGSILVKVQDYALPALNKLSYLVLLISPLVVLEIFQYKKREQEIWATWNPNIRMGFCMALLLGIIVLGAPFHSTFIYFQF